ncbi:hypothetical protein SAMN05216223_12312 [Actinacidiphila yanglinensis]|uniref:Helicase ATP-binding domain-containing protein n=1 Tax=Actinacidiphila yanglinensis TaxID=310779 RepID=A0A1H6DJ86_9ACTN|nr:hypothetical protein [Actinacidiphila yanglinensis]SEG85229.1 hypothetical protein SAMN05216223_11612 [Actinacidiphila yanglinensis]SEG91034.1 hypothetical protein SAMN05216223_12312 [Actinacidiphila yanglinensis]
MNSDDNGLSRREALVIPRLVAAACAAAQAHFPQAQGATALLTAAQFLVTGTFDVWEGYERLPVADQLQLSRLLRHRPNPLANDAGFRQYALEQFYLGEIPGFRLRADEETIDSHHGMNPRACLTKLLDELDTIVSEFRTAAAVAKSGQYTHTLRLPMAGRQPQPVLALYAFGDEHAPERRLPVERLVTAGELAAADVKIPEFLALSRSLDIAGEGRAFRVAALEPFFAKMTTGQGAAVGKVMRLKAGMTQVLSAPTGSGKSVWMRAAASWAVLEGHTIALVVDTNAAALKLARAIEEDLGSLRDDGLLGASAGTAEQVVVPLMSPHNLMREVERAAHSSGDPDFVDWVFGRIGYSCQLPALASVDEAVDTWIPGSEPCTNLTAVRDKPLEEYRSMPAAKVCPFKAGCGKYRLAREACAAQVIITTHANLYGGRMHIPLEMDDGSVEEKVSVEELVLRRCQIVLIDELDAFQSTAMDRSGRGLTLAWGDRGHDRPLLDLDRQIISAFVQLPGALEERSRSNLLECRRLAETYTMHLARGDLALSERLPEDPGRGRGGKDRQASRRWVLPERWDGMIARELAAFLADDPAQVGSSPQRGSGPAEAVLLEAVYDPAVASYCLPEHLREFARVVRSITAASASGGVLDHTRNVLFEMLTPWIPAPRMRTAVIERLVRRMFLVPLRRMLYSFVHDAPQLKLAGATAAEEIAQALRGFETWRAIPHGPMGRLVFAFTEDYTPQAVRDTRLCAAAFGGDPHRYVTSLGQITALAQAGHRRIVVGLSATAYIPGAHRHHVHARPAYIVADEDSCVEIDARPIPGLDQEWMRISGLTGKKRREATVELGTRLWSELSRDLETLSEGDTAGVQDSILLATTSYDSVHDLAEGLRQAGAPPGLVTVAVRPDPDGVRSGTQQEDLPWIELAGDRLEDFGSLVRARILIAPIKRAERSLNILAPGSRRSRIGAIWLAVRPMSIVDDPDELLAHVGARVLDDCLPHALPWTVLAQARKVAGRYFDELVGSRRYFSALPRRAKKAIAAELIASIIQLVGRARRGGTPGRIRLVDYAFLDPRGNSDLPSLIHDLRKDWARTGELDLLQATNGASLRAFLTFAETRSPARDTLDHAC